MGVNAILEQLPKLGNTFVTIDIDGLDPSIAPGTGSPTVDGLLYHEVRGPAPRRGQEGSRWLASTWSRSIRSSTYTARPVCWPRRS